jgi:hypothetical protein
VFIESIYGSFHRCSVALDALLSIRVMMKDLGVMRVGEVDSNALSIVVALWTTARDRMVVSTSGKIGGQ